MRIGVRSAISALVLTSIAVSAVGVHLLWWRTATQVSQTLADTINDQIVAGVADQLQSITTEARSASIAVRALITEKVLDIQDEKRRKFVFLSQLQAQPTISWVAFGWPDGEFFAAHKLGDNAVELLTIGSDRKLRSERYDYDNGDLKLRDNRVEDTKYLVTEQEWFRGSDLWSTLTVHPTGERPAAAFAVRIGLDGDGDRAGVLAVIIELTRVSNFLSQLTVGKSAGAFILDRDGTAIAAPDANADEVTPLKTEQPLFPVAVDAIRQAGSAYDAGGSEPFNTSVIRDGKAYKTVLTPISFPGWSLVTVVPELEFLGPVQATDPQPAGRPCRADRAGRRALGMAGAAADRCAPDPGGERDQACRALRSRQGAAASLAPDRDQQSLRRDQRHGAGARRVPKVHPGRPGAAPDQRRQRRAARRRGAADERDVHRSRGLHRHVGAAG